MGKLALNGMWTSDIVAHMPRRPGTTAIFTRGREQMEFYINHPVCSMISQSWVDLELTSVQLQDTGYAEESWGHKVSPADVVKYTSSLPGWPEVADRLIMTCPADLTVDWRLMWRDPQPKWTSQGGRVLQLGDAAHTFLPS